MSQKKTLETVLDLLLNEESDRAAEMLHQFIVERSRAIYESIVDEEETVDMEDESEELDEAEDVGGDTDVDFTAEISDDTDEIDTDHINDGEVDLDDEEAEDSEFDELEDEEEDIEDKVDDLESQLAELRAEFDALMGEELKEPNHADLASEYDADVDADEEEIDFDTLAEAKAKAKLEDADKKKKEAKRAKKVDEETKFLNTTGDTGQKSTAKLAGTGKNSKLGSEQNTSVFSKPTAKKDFGGTTKNIVGSKATGGEPGKYNGETAKELSKINNDDIKPKSTSLKADATAKYTGGKSAPAEFKTSPFSKKP